MERGAKVPWRKTLRCLDVLAERKGHLSQKLKSILDKKEEKRKEALASLEKASTAEKAVAIKLVELADVEKIFEQRKEIYENDLKALKRLSEDAQSVAFQIQPPPTPQSGWIEAEDEDSKDRTETGAD